MGLFALPAGDRSVDHAEAAMGNLKLFIEHNSGPYRNDYMLDFALHQVKTAIELYKAECDARMDMQP